MMRAILTLSCGVLLLTGAPAPADAGVAPAATAAGFRWVFGVAGLSMVLALVCLVLMEERRLLATSEV